MNSQSVRASLRLLGLVAFFATMPIYSPNIVPLFSALADSDLTGAFVWPFMIAVAVVSCSLDFAHSVLKGTFASHAPACVVVAYPLVTALFYLIMLGFLPSSMVVARLLGAISGVLFVPCSIVLARALSPCPLESALVTVCIAAGSSALLNWFSTYLSAIPLAVLYILLLGTIAVLSFTEPSKCSCDISFPAESCGSFLEIVTRFASVMAPALIGLSMFAFFMGVSRPNVTENTSADVMGMLLAAVTLAPLCLFARRFHHPMQTFFHQMLLPLLAVMILAAFAVFEPLTDCVVRALLSIGMYYFFGVVRPCLPSPSRLRVRALASFLPHWFFRWSWGVSHCQLWPESRSVGTCTCLRVRRFSCLLSWSRFIAYSLLPILSWGFGVIRPPVRILKKIRSIRLSRHLLPCAVKACRKNSLSRRGRAKFSAF